MTIKATYVSVWDGGTEIRTSCEYTPETRTASNIETINDVEDLDFLDEEFIELRNGEIIKDFTDADNDRKIVNGQLED